MITFTRFRTPGCRNEVPHPRSALEARASGWGEGLNDRQKERSGNSPAEDIKIAQFSIRPPLVAYWPAPCCRRIPPGARVGPAGSSAGSRTCGVLARWNGRVCNGWFGVSGVVEQFQRIRRISDVPAPAVHPNGAVPHNRGWPTFSPATAFGNLAQAQPKLAPKLRAMHSTLSEPSMRILRCLHEGARGTRARGLGSCRGGCDSPALRI